MKKIYRYLLMTVLAICLSIPAFATEAASIALLPLINNVQGDEVANQVYYKSAINAINAQNGFMLVENDKLTAAIEAANIAGKMPTKATFEKIAKEGNVDIVVAMELDKLENITIYSSEENKLQLVLDGKAVAYNRITGEFYQHRIYDDKTVPEALTTRWDVPHEEWGYSVKAEVKRILNVKKVTLDAPRMSKL